MQYSLALLGLAALAVAKPMPQVTADITPTAAAPAGCSPTFAGTFELSVVNITTAAKKMRKHKRQSSASDALVIALNGGVLIDSEGRTGYIAANDQFQFDEPPQTGAIYTGGFSVCANGTLALGGSAIWYECLSGGFYNLYSVSQGGQCYPIYLDAIAYSATTTTAAASQSSDGQIEASTAASSLAKSSQAIITTIGDNQPQAPTSTSKVSSQAIITTIGDNQPQAPTSASKVSSQAIITTISDNQPQAPTSASKVSSQAIITTISDNQPQAPVSASKVSSVSSQAILTTISDHQIQAPTSASVVPYNPTTSVAAYTGAAVANNVAAAAGALVFGAAAFLV